MIKPIFQESVADCGFACLAMIAGYHGRDVNIRQLNRLYATHGPLSAHDVVQVADKLNIHTRVLRLEMDEVADLRTPCILHWKLNHFVVLESIKNDKLTIIDPATGRRSISLREADRLFTGIALELSPRDNFTATKSSPSIELASLAKGLTTRAPTFIYIVFLLIGLEAITLSIPFVSQAVLDGAITSQDTDFLLLAVISGALLVSIQFFLGVASDVARLRLSQSVGFQWSANLFSHLLGLPWAYFQQRNIGDISNRFGSLKSVKDFLLTLLTGTAIDLGILAVACSLMITYSPSLALVVVTACICYLITRMAFYPSLKSATSERLVLSSREHGYFLESIRSVLTLKLSGSLSQRANQWSNLIVDVQNRDTATQKIQIMATAANTFIFGIESMAILYIGGKLIIAGNLSIGMLVAFMGFKSHFTSRFSRTVDTIFQWHLQSVYCDRVADIALHTEEELESGFHRLADQPLKVEIINVSFRQNPQSDWIIKNVNLSIDPGESVAIVGRSGSGKSTLAKLILGILEPSEGKILINGTSIRDLKLVELRSVIGTVLQEDEVLSGTVAENIAGFALDWSTEEVEKAAGLANLHCIINRLPMGYQTLISSTCSTLSAGQKQRLFLARALFKSPNLLVLDEATSNLDLHSEQHIISSLKNLPATQITIAHRRETLNLATRIIRLEGGMVIAEHVTN